MDKHKIVAKAKDYTALEKAFCSFTDAISALVSVDVPAIIRPSGINTFSAFGHSFVIEWKFVCIENEALGELHVRSDIAGSKPFLVLWFDAFMNIKTKPDNVFSSYNGLTPSDTERIIFIILDNFLALDCFKPEQSL